LRKNKILSKDKINIISKNNEINIIKYKSTLINHIPETLTIRRIYVDHEYAKRARDVVP
jgi:hypothetical protein